MTAQRDYWQECIAIAAEECDLTLTTEQLDYLASAAESGHEHYGQAFYSPPWSDRFDEIERDGKRKLKELQSEFDAYRDTAETAVKRALKVHSSYSVSIERDGDVLCHGGRTTQLL